MPANPLPLDAAARDELARKAEAAKSAERVWLDCPAGSALREGAYYAYRNALQPLAFIATPDVILALLAAVERGEAETEKAEEALDDEQNAHLETQRALVLLANQLETHSVPFVPAAELATYKARRDVEEFDKMLARGMEAAHQAYDAAKAKLDAARAHPPTKEPADG